jgi:rhodanese-related sulfurtransferase
METLIIEYRVISRTELRKKIERRDVDHLWNVLSREAFSSKENLPLSQHVPLETVLHRPLPARKNAAVILYSAGPRCTQAKQAAEKLKSLGYENVSVYEGGLEDWTGAGLPLVTI